MPLFFCTDVKAAGGCGRMAIYGAHQREGVSCMSDVVRGGMRPDRG